MKGPPIDWQALSPLVALIGGAVVVLCPGMLPGRVVQRAVVPVLAVASFAAAIGLSVWTWEPRDRPAIVSGALVFDTLTLSITIICCVAGILTVLLGVGGGFIVVPAMIYLLGMSTTVVVGTSLTQILFVTAATTIIHATTTQSVDIVLAVLLLLGSVVGAQLGARFAQRAKPELLRMFLAIMVLAVAFRMALGLGWRPPEIYTVEPL